MSEIKFKNKFIAFVDILGWKELVRAAEEGTGLPLHDLIEIVKELGTQKDRMAIEQWGPNICPGSAYVQRDLDFQLTQVSDCVVVSSEVSPSGLITLIDHCWRAVFRLLRKGVMCRGYITRGAICHSDELLIGSGYQEAYCKESQVTAFKRNADERGTPFVEIDPEICDYVANRGDSCVNEIFSRLTKGDGKVTALFPFKRLSQAFIVGGFGHKFNPEKEKQANQNMCRIIENLKEKILLFVDRSNPSAVNKSEHYIDALDEQIEIYRTTDEMIDQLTAPYPSSG